MTPGAGTDRQLLSANYCDGHSARRQPVTLRFNADGRLEIGGLDHPLGYALDQIRIEPRVGRMPRQILLPDGGMVETLHHEAVDGVLRRHGRGRGQRLVFQLERRWLSVGVALLLAIVATWGMVAWGLPFMARQVALKLPLSVERRLGQQSLAWMDQVERLKPTRLSSKDRLRVERVFQQLKDGLPEDHGLTLELRQSDDLGANALVLPAGILVVTDELVGVLKEDEELLAVMAHEAGHRVERHIMRQLLQGSVSSLVLMTWTGDMQAFSTLMSGLPTLLLHLSHSRAFEEEADAFAVVWLRKRGIPVTRFASALEKLRGEGDRGGGYLSSHPGWEERLSQITTPGS